MTAAQRRERDFWLGCAERADASDYFLCWGVDGDVQRAKMLSLFAPRTDNACGDPWWNSRSVSQMGLGSLGHSNCRVLAACFLAAMAELGE